MEQFPYPDDIVWRNPGFFSFTVPYDHTRDFFYSGHTGTLTLLFMEFVSLKLKVFSVLVGISWIFMLNVLLITKVHYMADIVGGLIFSLWFYRTAERIVIYFDKLLSLPYFCINWIYTNKCQRQDE